MIGVSTVSWDNMLSRVSGQRGKAVLQKSIPTISWKAPDSAQAIRDAVASSTFLLIEDVLSFAQCQVIYHRTLSYGGAQMLVPFDGENIVSFARNGWTEHDEIPVSQLLLEPQQHDNKNQNKNNDSSSSAVSVRLQTRLALDGILDLQHDLPNHMLERLLGGHTLNEEASMVFVTASQLRTPLHSDERHGMLLHISGIKNYVGIPAASSDANRSWLQELLTLRDTCGMHDDLYDAETPALAALHHIPGYYRGGPLKPGSALFLPQRNLHDIESVTPTISISLRFGRWDTPNE
jgi:hypothetical protein